jgi:hypothetical protein
MTGREMQIAVERQLQLRSELFKDVSKLSSDSIFYQLNKAQTELLNEYVKLGAERSEYIKSKIGGLFKEESIDVSTEDNEGVYNGIKISLINSWYILNEFITIINGDSEVQVRVDNIEHDYYNINKNNPFKKPQLLELCWSIDIESYRYLIYPGVISTYNYVYINGPSDITIDSVSQFNESAHEEIVALAVTNIINSFATQAKSK